MLNPAAIPHQRQSVLVIAPHPDDETLGCGGLIALGRQQSRFSIVFVTDGSASHPRSIEWPRSRLARCREKEAAEALRRLGAEDASQRFLGLIDAAMPEPDTPAWDVALRSLVTIIVEFQPDVALLPWRRDPHCDHRASWQLANSALHLARIHPLTLEYAIWLDEFGAPEDYPRPEEASRVVYDISGVLSAKQAAIAAHASQTTPLITDDPNGFRLTPATLDRLIRPTETYWWVHDAKN
jgi:LmbE family N-acetylglucosaminyl deacetylase